MVKKRTSDTHIYTQFGQHGFLEASPIPVSLDGDVFFFSLSSYITINYADSIS